tara:strand:+ start:200 stop:481 length:282 start_codon:yes stop_codon:yes gene_type:complete
MPAVTREEKYHPLLRAFEKKYSAEFDFWTIDEYDRAVPLGVYGIITLPDGTLRKENFQGKELEDAWHSFLKESGYQEKGEYELRQEEFDLNQP